MPTDRPPADIDFAQLMEQVASGSNEALQQLIERYASNLLRTVERNLPRAIQSKVDPMDTLQSVWLSVLKNRKRIAQLDSPERLVGYLAGMASTKVLERYRLYTHTQARDVRRESPMTAPVHVDQKTGKAKYAQDLCVAPTESASDAIKAREALQAILAHCNERDKVVITLRLQGETYQSIADQLGVEKRVVRRTLQKLLLAVPK
ncbi:MAG: sigma-70 family RNA polymerase sigma factor [Planctomycetota bacterium]